MGVGGGDGGMGRSEGGGGLDFFSGLPAETFRDCVMFRE